MGLRGIARANATIAEQAIEIERLKADNLAINQEAAANRAGWEQCTAQRDSALRLGEGEAAEVRRLAAENAELSEKVQEAVWTQSKLRAEAAKAKTARYNEITDLMTREQYWRQAASEAMEISTAKEALMKSGRWCEEVTKLREELNNERLSSERMRLAVLREEGRAERNWELYERTRGVLEELLNSVAAAKRQYYQEAFTPKTNN